MTPLDLSTLSTEDLEAELDRRTRERRVAELPKPLDIPDWSEVVEQCTDHVARLDAGEDGGDDDDVEHYIYEAAMEAVYGKGIWDWVNRRLSEDDDEEEG